MSIDLKVLSAQFPANPKWHLEATRVRDKLRELKRANSEEYEQEKERVYDLIEQHLVDDKILLGDGENSWDHGRRKIVSMGLFHTSNEPGIRSSRLSAIGLLRQYAPVFSKPETVEDRQLTEGKPVYSGHVRGGKQVFWVYHWLIRQDGNAEQLLRDNEVAWSPGNWDKTQECITVCFDGDFEESRPNNEMLLTAAELCHRYEIGREGVFGHSELSGNGTSPSKLFLINPEVKGSGWKEDLLDMIEQ